MSLGLGPGEASDAWLPGEPGITLQLAALQLPCVLLWGVDGLHVLASGVDGIGLNVGMATLVILWDGVIGEGIVIVDELALPPLAVGVL